MATAKKTAAKATLSTKTTAKAIHPTQAAARAVEKEAQLKKGFQKLLEQHGIEGWRITRFHMEPIEGRVRMMASCPPGTSWQCRMINGENVCGCFPDD